MLDKIVKNTNKILEIYDEVNEMVPKNTDTPVDERTETTASKELYYFEPDQNDVDGEEIPENKFLFFISHPIFYVTVNLTFLFFIFTELAIAIGNENFFFYMYICVILMFVFIFVMRNLSHKFKLELSKTKLDLQNNIIKNKIEIDPNIPHPNHTKVRPSIGLSLLNAVLDNIIEISTPLLIFYFCNNIYLFIAASLACIIALFFAFIDKFRFRRNILSQKLKIMQLHKILSNSHLISSQIER